jgi:hypothetical protein
LGQFALEKELNGTSGGPPGGDGPALRSEMEERNKLVELVKLQAKEVPIHLCCHGTPFCLVSGRLWS